MPDDLGIRALHQVVERATDLDRSIAFYRDVLGLALIASLGGGRSRHARSSRCIPRSRVLIEPSKSRNTDVRDRSRWTDVTPRD
jgi:hypothetical protein